MRAVPQLMLIAAIFISCEQEISGKINCRGVVVTKVGCYADNYRPDAKGLWSIHPLPDLLFTDFDKGSKKYSGIPYPKNKLNLSYIRGYICRCARNALATGNSMFGLQHYGECWSGKNALMTYSKHGPSQDCLSADFKECKGQELCIGEDNANFIFTVKKKKRPTPKKRPRKPTLSYAGTSSPKASTPIPSTPKPSTKPSTPKSSSSGTTPARNSKPTEGDRHFEFPTTPCALCHLHPGVSLPPWREPYPVGFLPIYQESYLEFIGSMYYLIAMYFEEYVIEETFDVGSLEYLHIKWEEERQIEEIYQDDLYFEEVEVVNISKTSPELHKRLKLIMEIGIYERPLDGRNYGGFDMYGGSYGTQYGSQHGGQYGGQYGSQYGSQYANIHGGQHGGQYGSQYGGSYGTHYGSQHGSQYGNIHGSQHGGQYGSQYGGQYGSQYSGQYGNHYGGHYGGQYGIEYLYYPSGPYDPYSLRGGTLNGGLYGSHHGGSYGAQSPYSANYGKPRGRNTNTGKPGKSGSPKKGAVQCGNSNKCKLKRKKTRVLTYFKLKFKSCGAHLRTLVRKVGYGNIARVSEIVPHRRTVALFGIYREALNQSDCGCCCCCNVKRSAVTKLFFLEKHVDKQPKLPSKCSCVMEGKKS